MKSRLASIGGYLLISAFVLLILDIILDMVYIGYSNANVSLFLLCGLIPLLVILGFLLLALGIGLEEKPPPGVAKL